MNIPVCPNHAKSRALCERSQLRLLGDNDHCYVFTCACCNLLWSVSKDHTKARAQWENRIARIQRATDEERERARRTAYSFPSTRSNGI